MAGQLMRADSMPAESEEAEAPQKSSGLLQVAPSIVIGNALTAYDGSAAGAVRRVVARTSLIISHFHRLQTYELAAPHRVAGKRSETARKHFKMQGAQRRKPAHDRKPRPDTSFRTAARTSLRRSIAQLIQNAVKL